MQEAALRAALLPAEDAVAGWDALRALTHDLDQTDGATFRLLPLAYRNLRGAGLSEGELGPLKGIYRQSWYRNRLTLASAGRVLETLASAGIEAVALKGLGLVATAYRDAALRPMHDIDILVRPREWRTAARALMASGWAPLRGTEQDLFRRIRVIHACALAEGGLEVDLHRYMLEESCRPGSDEHVWRRAVDASIGGTRVRVASAEDQFIHVCVHGTRDPEPSPRWIADAVTLLRAAEGFDWGYLAEECRARNVGLVVALAIAEVARYERAAAAGAGFLREYRAGALERADLRLLTARRGVLSESGRYVTRYARMTAGRTIGRRLAGFPTFLECTWELDRPSQVPVDGLRRIWSRSRGSR